MSKLGDKNTKKDFKRTVIGLLSGSILVSDFVRKQMPFLIFLSILALVYIANRYHAERVFRESETVKKEIKDLRAEKITVQSKLMRSSRRNEVLKMLNEKGSDLQESPVPPRKIYFSKPKAE